MSLNLAFFLSGVSMATFGAAAIFFLKFWRGSGDKLFLWFSVASFLLSIERAALVIIDMIYPQLTMHSEAFSMVYLTRLSAFIIIAFAVYQKNRTHMGK